MRSTIIPILATVLSSGPVSAQVCDPVEAEVIHASNGQAGDWFGTAIAVSNQKAVIGAYLSDRAGSRSGIAYVYHFNGNNWFEQEVLLPPDGDAGDHFGHGVAISGDLVVIGADGDESNNAGSAYVFRYDGDTWLQETKLVPSDPGSNDYFGSSTAIYGNTLVIGARNVGENNLDIGAAYVFEYDEQEEEWTQEAKLVPSDAVERGHFGYSAAMYGNTILIGARDSGSAYVFQYDGTQWLEEAKLHPKDWQSGQQFGSSVALGDGWAVIGEPENSQIEHHIGAAYAFRYDGSQWIEQTKLIPADLPIDALFGKSVAISGDSILVGAPHDGENDDHTGSAYLFRYDGDQWLQDAKIFPHDSAEDDLFGRSVALMGNKALVAAIGDEVNGQIEFGSVTTFDLNCEQCIFLAVHNLVADEKAEVVLTGGDPGAKAVTVYGRILGQTILNNVYGYCADFGIQNLDHNNVLGGLNRSFDANGEIRFFLPIPAYAAGLDVYFQAAKQGTCPEECMSNLIKAVVQ